MSIFWDPAKRARNLDIHGVDFEDAKWFAWDSCLSRASLNSVRASADRTEPRLFVLGLIGHRVHAMVFSVDRARVEIISLRKANRRETQRWLGET